MTKTLNVKARGEREIVMTRLFDAPRALVFDALLRPELVKRWLYGPEGHSLPVCEIDARPGGKLRYVWREASGQEMGMSGVFREIVPPERIVHTELFDQDWTGGEALATYVLAEAGGRTTLTLTMSYGSRAARDAVLKSPMEQGVAACFDRLATLLADPRR